MHKNYALVENGTVVNTIVWDGDTNNWTPPDGAAVVLIPSDQPVSIGWTYNGSTFSAPI